jgi:hypothetical protein
MAEKDSNKEEIRVEDKRLFDREGNPVRKGAEPKAAPPAEPQAQQAGTAAPAEEEKHDFVSILYSYVHTALVYLGEMEDPIQHRVAENLPGAKQMIDILELMQDKTKGNLDAREKQFLESVLYDLRMRFVEKSKIIK